MTRLTPHADEIVGMDPDWSYDGPDLDDAYVATDEVTLPDDVSPPAGTVDPTDAELAAALDEPMPTEED